ncbi:MAG: excinuclease ABC subunit UvrA [Syntrophomonadaceae bacterium]|jgi:excinuclease ABC subunit A|nr:excinuclease ABC subunit UvrA [Bacillota bacterium]NLM88048.1 excinuclease ABC subunit UvrA [Syntrophomonadaceae bacterium]HAA10048.1 excinuclease ABC subunit UvrA [Syntrophomonas sp.]HQA49979.1 excinuclease ABC subunit UvrA [Syntrophomonadaceae bacterium]
MVKNQILVKGAREHNLKNIDVTIPRDQLVVFTGVSGSGKSSLAFDTIYSEGQRRYVESLSTYARQFLGQMDKPDVDYIEGLSPSISIDQKSTSNNPRSTVGTVTEIYDYLRLLFARVGRPHCPHCHKPIQRQTIDQIVDALLALPANSRIKILAPVVKGQKGEHRKLLQNLFKDGFVRVIVDGYEYTSDEEINLDKNKKHDINVVVDRLVIKEGINSRLAESLELAFELSEGTIAVLWLKDEGEEELLFNRDFACPDCGFSLPELSPRMFSFNNPFGACPDCDGLGWKREIDASLVLDMEKSLEDGAIIPWSNNFFTYYNQILAAAAHHYKIPLDRPLKELTKKQIDFILYGNGGEKFKVVYTNSYGETGTFRSAYEGVINNLSRRYMETRSDYAREEIEKYMTYSLCPTCEGKRLREEILWVLVGGKSINQVTALSVKECIDFFEQLELNERETIIARQVVKEIKERLHFLLDVGLDYLTLDRKAGSLSGGEAQRIRLATQVGSSLVGVLYVLDEPSIGLHPRDNQRLLVTLKRLRDLGNTVIVVEHDEETVRSADHVIDIGPLAGLNGGEIVAQGTVEDIMACERSLTGQYLAGKLDIEIPEKRRSGNGCHLVIKRARQHNLKNIDVSIPLGKMVVVTGVSGSGKSTLVEEILYPALMKHLYGSRYRPGAHEGIEGLEALDKVVNIDQSPIGRTPRSNAATYTGVFDHIRELFAETAEAKMRGYKPGRFSFNVRGGRCEACSGDGIIKIEMHFLPDVYIPCEVCKGKRYNRETLEVKYRGKTIADVLAMTVDEAVDFFEVIPRVHRKLKVLQDVGLGYIQLGQPAPTLSGGEAQRVKLATELSKRSTGKTLYILDEPTTGLHKHDVKHLLNVLSRLTDAGNTVLIIEHNLDVIKCADHLIDLGPEGGDKGGQIVAQGTPEQVAGCPASYTGRFLRPILGMGDDQPNKACVS